MKKNPHIGSSLREWLDKEGIREDIEAYAVKEVLSWQITEAMNKAGITKAELARRMKTSRASIDRLLDPRNSSVTLKTLGRVANVLGLRLELNLVR